MGYLLLLTLSESSPHTIIKLKLSTVCSIPYFAIPCHDGEILIPILIYVQFLECSATSVSGFACNWKASVLTEIYCI